MANSNDCYIKEIDRAVETWAVYFFLFLIVKYMENTVTESVLPFSI